MKIFGVYELQIGNDRKINFLITENMVGQNIRDIFRVYDLKGSILNRTTKLTPD